MGDQGAECEWLALSMMFSPGMASAAPTAFRTSSRNDSEMPVRS
jgi:hypothetical protein